MDAFLNPVDRSREEYPDILQYYDDDDEVAVFELNVPVETLMTNSACAWESFSNILLREQLRHSFLWTSPDTFVAVSIDDDTHVLLLEDYDEHYSIDFVGTFHMSICSRTQEQVTPTLNLMFKLLAQLDEKQKKISLFSFLNRGPLPVSVPVLESFLQGISCDELIFGSLAFDEAQCQVVATKVREDVHVQFYSCAMTDGGATLAQNLRTNRFRPRKLTIAFTFLFNGRVLSAFKDALHVNTSLKSLIVEHFYEDTDDGNAIVCAIIEGLAANRGLSMLSLYNVALRDENWSSLMSSLCHHPALKVLRLSDNISVSRRISVGLSGAEKKTRTRKIKEMLEINTVLLKVNDDYLRDDEYDISVFENEINPLLEINAHRPMIRAVKEERDAGLRASLLTRALEMVRDKHHTLTHMLLTENADLVAEYGSKESRLRKRLQDLDHEITALDEEIARKVQRREQVTEERDSIARELLELP